MSVPILAKTISILTFNTWMVAAPFHLASLDIDARTAAIPAAVQATGADVVALQEVWPDKSKAQLIAEFKKLGYPFSFHEDLPGNWLLRGLIGNGLLIVSKIPLESPSNQDDRVLAYSDFTRPDEYFAHKGVLHVVLRLSPDLRINLYDTHLGAVTYDHLTNQPEPKLESARAHQWNQLAKFIDRTKHADPVILVGDFNTDLTAIAEPNDQTFLGLSNSFNVANQSRDSKDRFTVDAENRYRKHGTTSASQSHKKTIDYILVTRTPKIQVESSGVVFQENIEIPNRQGKLPLSDHYGVLTTLKLE